MSKIVLSSIRLLDSNVIQQLSEESMLKLHILMFALKQYIYTNTSPTVLQKKKKAGEKRTEQKDGPAHRGAGILRASGDYRDQCDVPYDDLQI